MREILFENVKDVKHENFHLLETICIRFKQNNVSFLP